MPKEFDKLKLAIKAQLKKDNSNLSEEELENKSFAIATSQWKKSHGGKAPESFDDNKKYDEFGREIIAENIKFYIEAGIGVIEE